MQPAPEDHATAEDGFTVSILVDVDPLSAFAAFTEQIDLWWLRGPKHRFRAPYHDGMLRFTPGVGGSLVEHYPDGTAFAVGEVLDWQPGARLHLAWRLPNFTGEQQTDVIVRFEAEHGQTRVSVEQRGFASLPLDHPARHGHRGRALAFAKSRLWAELLTALRHHLKQGDDS
jgi:uncharacterized protein YndB with AHSA1/START domain